MSRRDRSQKEQPSTGPRLAPSTVHDVVGSPGKPLERETRAGMEAHFGHDFSRVRVHDDEAASASARAVDARAYTVGRDVVFAQGEYARNAYGTKLLEHELAHVVQQEGAGRPGADLSVLSHDHPAERDATATSRLPTQQLARQPAKTGAPGASLVASMRINLTAGTVVLKFQSGKEIKGTVITDLEPGSYVLHPDLFTKKWAIPGTKPGLRFDIELEGPSPWTYSYPKALSLTVEKGSPDEAPTGSKLEGDTVPIEGDPERHPNYIENAIKSVGIPIWGGPIYLYHVAHTSLVNTDAVVLPRSAFLLEKVSGSPTAILEVYKSKAAADAVVSNFGSAGAYTFYIGPGGHIYPTVISDASAPAVCAGVRAAIDDDKKGAKAAADLAVDLALWYAGARFGPKPTGEPAAAAESMSAAKQAQQLAEQMAAKHGKVVLNLGGTGEVAEAINVNLLKDQAVKGIPNLVKAGAEEIGGLFKPGSVDKIVSNNIVRGQVNWVAAAKGAFQTLKGGGQVSIAPYAGSLAEHLAEIESALRAAGFKDVKVIAETFITAVKP